MERPANPVTIWLASTNIRTEILASSSYKYRNTISDYGWLNLRLPVCYFLSTNYLIRLLKNLKCQGKSVRLYGLHPIQRQGFIAERLFIKDECRLLELDYTTKENLSFAKFNLVFYDTKNATHNRWVNIEIYE